MKEYDWIVANINNPDFTVSDFKDIQGLNLTNTQLLSMEDYLKSSFVTENDMFKGNDGTFNQDKFKNFYQNQASRFNKFAVESNVDNYEYGFWDIAQKPDSRVKNPNFDLSITINPEHISTGVVGPGLQGERTKSDMELASRQKIFDYKTGKFIDKTAEDLTLIGNPINFFKNLFSDSLVLAQYEEDTDEVDPITGEVIHHKKGDNKLNDYGEYYLETLNDRSVIGKKFLSLGDIMTKEDSLINKYDFFDSDGLDKSTTGVIAKNLTAIAPMLLGGPVSTAYSGFYIAREMFKTLPMLYQFATILGNDEDDPKLVNTLAGIGQKFTGSTSEYAGNKTFSIENFGNLIADVALQWGQQKLVAQSIANLSKGGDKILKAAEAKAMKEYEKQAVNIWNQVDNDMFDVFQAKQYTGADGISAIREMLETGKWKATSIGSAAMQKFIPEAEKQFSRRAILGQDLSLAYMSLISNTDVYESAIEHGATKKEAAALALGSTIGMFGVDKYMHLGEIFFDETPEKMAIRNLRQGIKEEADKVAERFAVKSAERGTQKGLIGLIKSGMDSAKNAIDKYESGLKNHTLGFFGKAFGEGLEETAEEFVTDMSKSLFELAGDFGWVSVNDFGSWDNAGERYAMSFLGGAIGGGLYYGVDAIKNPKSTADKEIQKELLYLVSQGKTKDILDELEKQYKSGKLGSTNLSRNLVQNSDGDSTYLTAKEGEETQNDFVYKLMKNAILQMDSIINENGLGFTDDKLFEKMVIGDQRYIALKNSLFDKSYITQYYDDFQSIVNNIYVIEKQIQDLKTQTNDSEKREDNSNYQEKLEELEKQKQELIKEKDAFLSGEYNLEYVDKMLFYLHPEVSGNFFSVLFEQYAEEKSKKDYESLSEGEIEKYRKEWAELRKTKGKEYLDKAYKIYKDVRKKLESGLSQLSKDDINAWGDLLKEMSLPVLQWNERVPKNAINVNSFLHELRISKSDEYDKPWRSDPSKSNKAFKLYLDENPSLYFEVVKDLEDGYWSIHFKTADPTDARKSALTKEQKQRLFRAAAVIIPEGDKISTWGSLTKGGVSGINRFGQTDYMGGIEYQQVGTRKVKLKQPDFKSMSDEDLLQFVQDNINLAGDSTELDQNLFDNIEQGNKEILSRDTIKDKAFDITRFGKGASADEKYLTDIDIPIWQRLVSGETDEEYEKRDEKLEGESKEDYEKRRGARKAKIEQYNKDHFFDILAKFINTNDIIDRSTYRRIIAALGIRTQDFLKQIIISQARKKISPHGIVSARGKIQFNEIVKNELLKLEPDLSNRDEVVQRILEQTTDTRTKEFREQYEYMFIQFNETGVPYDVNLDGFVLFKDLLKEVQNFLNEDYLEDYESFKEEFPVAATHADRGSQYFDKFLRYAYNIAMTQIEQGVETSPEIDQMFNDVEEEIKRLPGINRLDSEGEFEPNDVIFVYGNELQDDLKDQHQRVNRNLLERDLNEFIDDIETSKEIKTLNEFKRKTTLEISPVAKLLKMVFPKLGEDFSDIETTLEEIYDQFNSLDVPSSFVLNKKQLQALKKAQTYLPYVLGVIQSASKNTGYFDFLPYNKSINDFIESHKDVVKDVENLLELDEDLAKVLTDSLEHFNVEISEWIRRAQQGAVNKRQMFANFDRNFTQARLDFFKQIRDQVKISAEKDLLKGIEHLDIDKPDAIFEIEKLFYNNFKEQNWTVEDLIQVIDKQTIFSDVLKQTSNIGKSINNENMTLSSYDKFIYLIALAGGNPIDFYQDYKSFVKDSTSKDGKKLAPLTFQEYNMRLAYVQKNNSEFINEVLSEYNKKHPHNNFVLENASVISGRAGTGKTDVVIRFLINDDDTVWISGPSNTQIEALQKIAPKAIAHSKEELFIKILGNDVYKAILNELSTITKMRESGKTDAFNGKYIQVDALKGDLGQTVKLKFDAITYASKDVPSQLVIDEITLFSAGEIQILSDWAKKNNVNLIFAGDKNQNGDYSIGDNIERMLKFETPEMTITLRDSNIWKYKNQDSILNLLDTVDDKTDPDRLKNSMKNLEFSYYQEGNKFTGELITDKFNDFNSLDGTIAYIGSTSTQTYQDLKNSGKSFETFGSVEEIQGKEFDYVISDIDLKYDYDRKTKEWFALRSYLKKLYTIISRSRKGTVIINNGLTESIKQSKKQTYSTENVSLTPEAVEEYVNSKLKFIDSLNMTRKIPVESKAQEPISETETFETTDDPEEELEKNPKESEDNDEDDIPIEEQAKGRAFFPAYGNVNLSGLKQNSDGTLSPIVETIDGEKIKTDLGIFLNDDDVITVKDRSLKQYFQLKSILLFQDLYHYDTLDSRIKDLFKKEDLKGVKYYAVCEKYDEDKHRIISRNSLDSGLKQDELKFSDGNVYLIKCRITSSYTKEQFEITLGGLSKPETLQKNSEQTKKNLDKRISEIGDESLKKELEEFRRQYDDRITDYEKSELPNLALEGRRQINKPYFDRCTRLRYVKDGKGNKVYIPLNGWFDTLTSDLVISPVYAQINPDKDDAEELFPGLGSDDKGKPVIFVTANMAYSPGELAKMYGEQKASPEDHYPEIRKIILSPRGVSFESLVFKKARGMQEIGDKGEIKFPFSNTAVALRMYISLWNFRARLRKFNDELADYLKNNGISEETIQELAKKEAAAYTKPENDENTFREELKSSNPTLAEELKPLWDLNDYLDSKGVEQFRLGYNSKHGLYSRRLSNGKVGTYINLQLSKNYLDFVDGLFKQYIDKVIPVPSKTVVTTILGKSSDFEKKGAGESWVKSLRNNKTIKLTFTDENGTVEKPITISGVDLIRSIPYTLVKICRLFDTAQSYDEGFEGFIRDLNESPVDLKKWVIELSNEDATNALLNLKDCFAGGIQSSSDTMSINDIPEENRIPGVVSKNSETGEGIFDRRILNFFSLAFHGKVGDGESAEGTIFKHGIFADTFLVEGSYKTDSAFGLVSTDEELYATNILPQQPVLKVSLDKFDDEEVVEEAEDEEVTEEQRKVEEICNLFKIDEVDLETAIDSAKQKASKNADDVRKKGSTESDLNKIIYWDGENLDSAKSLKDLVREKYGVELTTFPETNGIINASGIKTFVVTTSDGVQHHFEITGEGELYETNTIKPKISDAEMRNNIKKSIESIKADFENNQEELERFDEDAYEQSVNDLQSLLENDFSLDDIKLKISEIYNYYSSLNDDNIKKICEKLDQIIKDIDNNC